MAATKSRKVAATKSSKTDLHTKNSQAATMPQLAAAARLHACCLLAARHCEKPFISIRVISCSVTEQLICAFVFAFAKSRFYYDTAHFTGFWTSALWVNLWMVYEIIAFKRL